MVNNTIWKKRVNTGKFILCHLVAATFLICCDDFLIIDAPKNQISTVSVFANDATAKSAVSGIYTQMSSGGFASGDGSSSVTFLGGVSADEFTNFDLVYKEEFYRNSISPSSATGLIILWSVPYQCIYASNAVLEGLSKSTTVSPAVKAQLEGEVRFIRGFCYFYLVNLFGDVPLHTTTNYRITSTTTRASKDDVYKQIIDDLIFAERNLLNDYSASGERVIPNKAAAQALLARVYLYLEDWKNAELKASDVINQTDLYGISAELDDVFLKNSIEAIWQLMPVQPGNNTNEGFHFILEGDPALFNTVSVSDYLLGAFEDGDKRRVNWVNSFSDGINTWYFPFKYKVRTGLELVEYSMVLRLAEQYLIRSEARAHLDNLPGAVQDIDVIRQRAGLSLIQDNNPLVTIGNLLLLIEHERRIELFSEWGHRWLDLKRTNRADAVLAPIKPEWQSTDVLYPIPNQERLVNINIGQNPGY